VKRKMVEKIINKGKNFLNFDSDFGIAPIRNAPSSA